MKFDFKRIAICVLGAIIIVFALYQIFKGSYHDAAKFEVVLSESLEPVMYYEGDRNYYLYGLEKVTVTYMDDTKELKEFLQFVGKLYAIGVDALILQDVGAAKLVQKQYPDFCLHASTQMIANSLEDVQYWYEQGFSKVVLSRELTLPEIRYITEHTDAEVETFIHGALCVCYSGQCIMSSMLGGRSGNRGRCAQTCRLPYTL